MVFRYFFHLMASADPMLTSNQNGLYNNCGSLIDLSDAFYSLSLRCLVFLDLKGADKAPMRNWNFQSPQGIGLKCWVWVKRVSTRAFRHPLAIAKMLSFGDNQGVLSPSLTKTTTTKQWDISLQWDISHSRSLKTNLFVRRARFWRGSCISDFVLGHFKSMWRYEIYDQKRKSNSKAHRKR